MLVNMNQVLLTCMTSCTKVNNFPYLSFSNLFYLSTLFGMHTNRHFMSNPDFKVAPCVCLAGGTSRGYCRLKGDVQRASKLACQQGKILPRKA